MPANPRILPQMCKGFRAVARNAGTFSATPVAGDEIDRQVAGTAGNGDVSLAQSVKFIIAKEATTGSPSTQTLDVALYHCATSGGTFTAYTDPSTGAASATTQDTSATAATIVLNADLSNAYRYIKIKVTANGTSGTSPATPFSATADLMGFSFGPVQSST